VEGNEKWPQLSPFYRIQGYGVALPFVTMAPPPSKLNSCAVGVALVPLAEARVRANEMARLLDSLIDSTPLGRTTSLLYLSLSLHCTALHCKVEHAGFSCHIILPSLFSQSPM
jgi:hypothetical protein